MYKLVHHLEELSKVKNFQKKFSEEVRDSIVNYFAQKSEIKTFEKVNNKGIREYIYASAQTKLSEKYKIQEFYLLILKM
jgi:ribosomal protein S20